MLSSRFVIRLILRLALRRNNGSFPPFIRGFVLRREAKTVLHCEDCRGCHRSSGGNIFGLALLQDGPRVSSVRLGSSCHFSRSFERHGIKTPIGVLIGFPVSAMGCPRQFGRNHRFLACAHMPAMQVGGQVLAGGCHSRFWRRGRRSGCLDAGRPAGGGRTCRWRPRWCTAIFGSLAGLAPGIDGQALADGLGASTTGKE